MSRLRKNGKSGRNSGRIFFISGTVLITAAALLLGGYLFRGYHTEKYCGKILEELLPLIPDRTPGTVPDTLGESQAVLEVEGISCVGALEIPFLGKSWPVAGAYEDGTDLPRLGSSEDNGTIIINDAEGGLQFNGLTQENIGEKVRFTDIYGRVYTWQIAGIVNGAEEELQGAGLVLLTRDRLTGEQRAVLCTRS